MPYINQIDETGWSRDYARLIDLASKVSVACCVAYRHEDYSSRDVAKSNFIKNPDDGSIYSYQVDARGIGYIWAETEEEFIKACEGSELSFLDVEQLVNNLDEL